MGVGVAGGSAWEIRNDLNRWRGPWDYLERRSTLDFSCRDRHISLPTSLLDQLQAGRQVTRVDEGHVYVDGTTSN